MRAFHYTAITSSETVKLVSPNVLVRYNYTGATSLIIYVKGGITPANMTEIVDDQGTTVTRYTATGTGSYQINMAGLTPGTLISVDTVSGTGTVTMDVLTGTEG